MTKKKTKPVKKDYAAALRQGQGFKKKSASNVGGASVGGGT